MVAGLDSHSANYADANTASTSLRGDKSTFSVRAAAENRGINGVSGLAIGGAVGLNAYSSHMDTSTNNQSANVSGRGRLTPNANSLNGGCPGSVRSNSFLKENNQMFAMKSSLRNTFSNNVAGNGGSHARYMRTTKSSRSKLRGR